MNRQEKIAAYNKAKEASKLPDSVAKDYEIPGGDVAGRFILQQPVRREVDLGKITVAEAKELAGNENFPYLREKKGGKTTDIR